MSVHNLNARQRPREVDGQYSHGWHDGFHYCARLRSWRWRAQGVVAGLLIAAAIAGLVTFFGGR